MYKEKDKNLNNKRLGNGSRVEDGQFKENNGFVLPEFKRFLQYTLIDGTEKNDISSPGLIFNMHIFL